MRTNKARDVVWIFPTCLPHSEGPSLYTVARVRLCSAIPKSALPRGREQILCPSRSVRMTGPLAPHSGWLEWDQDQRQSCLHWGRPCKRQGLRHRIGDLHTKSKVWFSSQVLGQPPWRALLFAECLLCAHPCVTPDPRGLWMTAKSPLFLLLDSGLGHPTASFWKSFQSIHVPLRTDVPLRRCGAASSLWLRAASLVAWQKRSKATL